MLQSLYSDFYLSGIATWESNICWYQDSSLGECPRRFLNIGHHNRRIFQAAKDVNAGQDMLVDLFERIGRSFTRLETYTEPTPSEGMTSMMMEVTVEALSILVIVTVEIRQSRRS